VAGSGRRPPWANSPGGAVALGKTIKDGDREVMVRRRPSRPSAPSPGRPRRRRRPDRRPQRQGQHNKKGGDPNAAANDLRLEVIDALGRIANSKDEGAIKALEALSADKKAKGPLKNASSKAAQEIKNRK